MFDLFHAAYNNRCYDQSVWKLSLLKDYRRIRLQ